MNYGEQNIVTLKRSGLAVLSLLLIIVSACKGSSGPAAEPAIVFNEIPVIQSPDNPISITGAPETRAMAYGYYEFVPLATHSENQQLAFSISNKPDWAEFDPITGALSGIPNLAHVALYSGIVISASDGEAFSELEQFSIDVYVPVLTGATVNWLPPGAQLDGTELDGLSGYIINYGTSRYKLPHSVWVPSTQPASIFVDNIPAGLTYYFAIRAVDVYEQLSPYSQIVEASL